MLFIVFAVSDDVIVRTVLPHIFPIFFIAKSFKIKPVALFNEETARLSKKLPARVDMYKK